VRSYLAEFLSDPRVVPLPRFVWLPILHGIVLRRRPPRSAAKYAAIWTAEGSPLAVHTRRQAAALQILMADTRVEYAMRYGEPSLAAARVRLPSAKVLPLYPQYSDSTTGSITDAMGPGQQVVMQFYDHPAYIEALAANLRRYWQAHGRGAKLVMSYHGLPKRGGALYAGQCYGTSKLLADKLQLGADEWVTTFQSRFGFAEWLQPYTAPTLVSLAQQGIDRLDVVCPGFVSDCLETLEEIGIEARRAYITAGGREFHLIPCLNESPEWIAALADIASDRAAP
jgi:protoporphyrin/coproporphyrin ferrochelatase